MSRYANIRERHFGLISYIIRKYAKEKLPYKIKGNAPIWPAVWLYNIEDDQTYWYHCDDFVLLRELNDQDCSKLMNDAAQALVNKYEVA